MHIIWILAWMERGRGVQMELRRIRDKVMGPAAQIRKVAWAVRGGVDIFMFMIIGIRRILGGYRIRRIFLGVWRLMELEGLWMVGGGGRGVGLIGFVRGMGCEFLFYFGVMVVMVMGKEAGG